MIQAKNLNHYYDRFHALKNVSFSLPTGTITGLIGQNGAGKSTLLKTLAGFLMPAEGEIIVDGLSFFEHPIAVRQKIGYMPETPLLYRDMKVTEYLDYVGCLKGLSRKVSRQERERLITHCGLKKVYHKLIGNLSKGNRQRVAMAQALTGDPKMLLLDEPTSAMDPAQVIEIRQFISELTKNGTTVLMSSHILSEISQICDYIVCIQAGEVLYEGTLADLIARQNKVAGEFVVRFSEIRDEWLPFFGGLPGGDLCARRGCEMVFAVNEAEIFLPSLIRIAAERRLPVREMLWSGNQLESLFKQGVVS